MTLLPSGVLMLTGRTARKPSTAEVTAAVWTLGGHRAPPSPKPHLCPPARGWPGVARGDYPDQLQAGECRQRLAERARLTPRQDGRRLLVEVGLLGDEFFYFGGGFWGMEAEMGRDPTHHKHVAQKQRKKRALLFRVAWGRREENSLQKENRDGNMPEQKLHSILTETKKNTFIHSVSFCFSRRTSACFERYRHQNYYDSNNEVFSVQVGVWERGGEAPNGTFCALPADGGGGSGLESDALFLRRGLRHRRRVGSSGDRPSLGPHEERESISQLGAVG